MILLFPDRDYPIIQSSERHLTILNKALTIVFPLGRSAIDAAIVAAEPYLDTIFVDVFLAFGTIESAISIDNVIEADRARLFGHIPGTILERLPSHPLRGIIRN